LLDQLYRTGHRLCRKERRFNRIFPHPLLGRENLRCSSTFFSGLAESRQIEISTSARKYDPTYNITFRVYKKSEVTNVANVTAKKGFADWFDEEGTFVKIPFDNWLGTNIIEAEKKLVAAKSKKRN
jgi:Microsomal signal peptidase 25 kDa subunit (SPC25)